jgi:hypothetical protein
MHSVIQEKYDNSNRHFAICESCYWTATIFETNSQNRYSCPACPNKNLALIPLAKNEQYFYEMDSKRGLNIEFSR